MRKYLANKIHGDLYAIVPKLYTKDNYREIDGIEYQKHTFTLEAMARKMLLASDNYDKKFSSACSYIEKDRKRKLFLKDSQINP